MSRRPRRWPDGWSGPWWLERQASAAPSGGGARAPGAGSAVGWTALGALGGPQRLLVDPRGFVQVAGASWGVDWWVGADDRWHLPARDAAVRQALVDGVPVVATAVRVPGGDVVATVAAHAGGGRALASIEVHDDSPGPVAVALAVRPVTLDGPGALRRVALDGTTVLVDGIAALHLPIRPGRVLLSTGAGRDPMLAVTTGGAGPAVDGEVSCREGLAGIVVVLPLAHRARLTWQVDLSAAAATHRLRRPRRQSTRPPPPPATTPAQVAAGWSAQLGRRPRIVLPAGRTGGLLAPLTAHLLLAAGEPGAAPVVLAAAAMAGAADRPVDLRAAPARADLTLALWAAAQVAALGGPRPPVADVAGAAEAVAAAARKEAGAPSAQTGPEPAALLLRATSQAAAGEALGGAARLLGAAGERRAAAAASVWAAEAAGRAGRSLPLAPLWAPPPPATGPGTAPAADMAAAARAWSAGDPGWWAEWEEVARAATPTVTWPDRLDPATGWGCGHDGQDADATARAWALLRAAVAAEVDGAPGAGAPGGPAPGRLELLRTWPAAWDGVAVEGHDLPTRCGRLSFAVRWHGPRPALLWEVAGAPAGLVVAAPGLDAGWSATAASGEALLAGPAGERPGPAGERPGPPGERPGGR